MYHYCQYVFIYLLLFYLLFIYYYLVFFYLNRIVKVSQNRHILYRKLKHWVLVVPRTNHRHFTWVPMKSLQPHTIYVEESKVDEERFHDKFKKKEEEGAEVSKKDQIDFVKYSNAYGAYERASSYINKNNF